MSSIGVIIVTKLPNLADKKRMVTLVALEGDYLMGTKFGIPEQDLLDRYQLAEQNT
jgi:hypothetical protein